MALTYKEKMAQASREARATLLGLAVVIVAWCALGFGLAGVDIYVAGMPLWALAGTVGTWLVALGVCVVLARHVFIDFPLEDEPHATPGVSGASAGKGANND